METIKFKGGKNMNKLVSGLVKSAIVAAIGFVAGITIAEKSARKEEKELIEVEAK